MELAPLLASIETSWIATTVGGSTRVIGFVSAIHLLGLTVVAGGALVSSLGLLGALFPDRPVSKMTTTVEQGVTLGLAISVGSGLLLFAPRASAAADNGIFVTKMLLLAAAAVFHFTVYHRVIRRVDAPVLLLRMVGALGFALWFGVAVAGCAYILLE